MDGTRQFDDHQPEIHLPPGNQEGEVDPAFDVHGNPGTMSDLEENTAHTTRQSEPATTLVSDCGVVLTEKKPPGVSWLSPGSLPREHHLLPHARRE